MKQICFHVHGHHQTTHLRTLRDRVIDELLVVFKASGNTQFEYGDIKDRVIRVGEPLFLCNTISHALGIPNDEQITRLRLNQVLCIAQSVCVEPNGDVIRAVIRNHA